MSLHPQDDVPVRSDAHRQERESAMLLIWALLGLLVIVLFSIALWA